MTEPTILDTVTTVDQNTGRPVVWNVEHVTAHGDNTRGAYGYTHVLAVSRPKGRRVYALHVEMIGDVVVRHSTPTVMF